MDKQACVQIILHECVATEGFLTRLRGREFSHEHYDSLIQALRQYREFVREQEFIERQVACCLYYLELGLSAALEHFPKTDAEKRQIHSAYIESSNLILEIITPEFMTGPLPEKLK